MFNLGLTYDDSIVYGGMNCRYSSKRFFLSNNTDTVIGVLGSYDPYTLVDVKAGYRINRNIDVSLAVSNLLDREFYDSIKTEGRAWFAQASLKF